MNTPRSAHDGLRAALASAARVLLTGPVDPDGDSIGACLALQAVIRARFDAEVVVAGEASYRYAWMDGADEMLASEAVEGPFDLAIVLDGNRRRLPAVVGQAYEQAGLRAIIDHHGTTSPEGYDLPWIDSGAASTCGMVLELMDAWEVALTPSVASLLYVGLIFDTGGFRYSNTQAGTHQQAARLLAQGIDHAAIAVRVLMQRRPSGMRLQGRVLDTATFHGGGEVVRGVVSLATARELGVQLGDIEGIVESMLYADGVEVAALLIERGPRQIRLSMRSRGLVDVSQVARGLHACGGGHAKAAGVTLGLPLEEAKRVIAEALVRAIAAARG